MKRLIIGFFIAMLFHVSLAVAQQMQHRAMQDMEMNMPSMNMSGMVLLTDSMSQEGSGTSWIPVATPMHAFHFTLGDSWPVMLHGALTVRYTDQGANDYQRSAEAVSSPNWIMAMTQHKLGDDDQVALRVMMSLDRVTEGGDGYPLLFQTGESWEGKPLVDRQHPHDLFGELSAAYSHRFNEMWNSNRFRACRDDRDLFGRNRVYAWQHLGNRFQPRSSRDTVFKAGRACTLLWESSILV